MSELLVLSYRRVGADMTSGSVLLVDEDSTVTEVKLVDVLERFDEVPFISALKVFARYARTTTATGAQFHRTDATLHAPIRITHEEFKLWKTDPATVIQRYMVPPQVVHVGVEKKPRHPSRSDALEDVFGSTVLVRRRGEDLECPECGAWARQVAVEEGPAFHCAECDRLTHVKEITEKWTVIEVKELLETKSRSGKYFLPRAWNKNGNWISFEELQAMHKKE